MDILLIIPPFIQLNTPYTSITSLTGFLKEKQFAVTQRDLSLDLFLSIHSRNGLQMLFENAQSLESELSENALFILENKDLYITTIDSIIKFLQNEDPTLATRICTRNMLPEASRFMQFDDVDESFGYMGIVDKAKHIATLYLEDIADFIKEAIDGEYGMSRYAESLALSAESFDSLNQKLCSEPSIIDTLMLDIFDGYLQQTKPRIVGISIPFPGNVYMALRCGKYIKENYTDISVVLGGGYVNTELRQLTEKRIFNYTNYICLDDGERPLYHLAERIINKKNLPLVRTYCISDNEIEYNHDAYLPDFQHSEIGTPSFDGLTLSRYVSLIEMVNPMHRLWSDGRWNKLQIAHGCYWGQCTFCDTSLDYIKRFSMASAEELCNRIEHIIKQTGQTGFHFVDEAAPPRVLKELAIELIERELNISWWANIRFEEYFDYDICELLAASGCIAVSGGIEVASPRILKLINKGVSLDTLIKVTNNFSTNNIMVHGYLMYGFPSQTMQETIDSLDVVRQMFLNNCLHSAFWHQFVMTIHSPVGKKPQQFGAIRLDSQLKAFANNDLKHTDESKLDHSIFSDGLKKALYNYMHNNGLDLPLQEWFNFKIPPSTIPSKYVFKILKQKKEK